MMIAEFLNDLEDSYSGKLSKTNFHEIKEIVEDLDEDQIGKLYKHIKYNYKKSSLPTIAELKGFMDWLGYRIQSNVGYTKLHEQSPFNAVVNFQQYTTEWLVQQCDEIRALDRELTGKEISFITYWENLKSVPFEYRKLMKKYIIENDTVAQHDLMQAKGEKVSLKELRLKTI